MRCPICGKRMKNGYCEDCGTRDESFAGQSRGAFTPPEPSAPRPSPQYSAPKPTPKPPAKPKQNNRAAAFFVAIPVIVVLVCGVFGFINYAGDGRPQTVASPEIADPVAAEAMPSHTAAPSPTPGPPIPEEELESLFAEPKPYYGRTATMPLVYMQLMDWVDSPNNLFFCGDPGQWSRLVFAEYSSPAFSIEPGECAVATGRVTGSTVMETDSGGTVNAVYFQIEKLEKADFISLFSPAVHTLKPTEGPQPQYGAVVTVDRVELAENQTRVYITVLNNGPDRYHLAGNLVDINQGAGEVGREAGEGVGGSYQRPDADIAQGESVSAVVVLDPIDPQEDFTVVIDAYLSDRAVVDEMVTFHFEAAS